MTDEQDPNGNGEGDHPLRVVVDIDDWITAGAHVLRAVRGIGRGIPPADGGRAAELSQLIARADEAFRLLVEGWEADIRPRLKKFEGVPVPPLVAI